MINVLQLAQEIIDGKRLSASDDLSFFVDAPLDQLCQGANEIRKALCGNTLDLCSIINGRGGRCSENCKFCAQSAHNHTSCDEYDFLETSKFIDDCKGVYRQGVNRYSIVTAGRTMEGEDLEKAIVSYEKLHQEYPDMILCASHGLVSQEAMHRFKKAGVTMYHTNVETSKNNFPNICTTHTYEDKLEEIQRARNAGLTVCCGGILGMGETWEDRINMALEIAELKITSIPLNFLIPIKGTPLENQEKLTPDEILRIVALFRFINPTAFVRIAAGRSYFNDGGKCLFEAGANATLTGDMLTTVGNNTAKDREMLSSLGFKLKNEVKIND